MNDFSRDFMMGGAAMFPIALLGFLGIVGGVTTFSLAITIAKARTLWVAAALMAFGTLGPITGVLGYTMGRNAMEQALAHVNPQDVEVIRLVGTSEALTCIQYGIGAGLIPFCLGLALVGTGLVRLRPSPA